MKTTIQYLSTAIAAISLLTLGACSSMPESHKADMQTHEMGTPGKTRSMSNSMMPNGQ